MLAQNLQQIQSQGLPGFKGGTTIGEFFANSEILNYVFYAAGMALLVYMIIGGLQMMVAKGDPKALQAAQAKITNALIGFFIVVGAFSLTKLVGELLGLGIFKQVFQ